MKEEPVIHRSEFCCFQRQPCTCRKRVFAGFFLTNLQILAQNTEILISVQALALIPFLSTTAMKPSDSSGGRMLFIGVTIGVLLAIIAIVVFLMTRWVLFFSYSSSVLLYFFISCYIFLISISASRVLRGAVVGLLDNISHSCHSKNSAVVIATVLLTSITINNRPSIYRKCVFKNVQYVTHSLTRGDTVSETTWCNCMHLLVVASTIWIIQSRC